MQEVDVCLVLANAIRTPYLNLDRPPRSSMPACPGGVCSAGSRSVVAGSRSGGHVSHGLTAERTEDVVWVEDRSLAGRCATKERSYAPLADPKRVVFIFLRGPLGSARRSNRWAPKPLCTQMLSRPTRPWRQQASQEEVEGRSGRLGSRSTGGNWRRRSDESSGRPTGSWPGRLVARERWGPGGSLSGARWASVA